jgi:hypothetical protein
MRLWERNRGGKALSGGPSPATYPGDGRVRRGKPCGVASLPPTVKGDESGGGELIQASSSPELIEKKRGEEGRDNLASGSLRARGNLKGESPTG